LSTVGAPSRRALPGPRERRGARGKEVLTGSIEEICGRAVVGLLAMRQASKLARYSLIAELRRSISIRKTT